ncbi:MAG: hypothetical protein WCT50_01190 [Patescibacteria group bacterium]
MLGTLATVIFVVILAGMFTYFYVTLNRMDKKMTELQTVIATDSAKISEIVNFFNANVNAQDTNK